MTSGDSTTALTFKINVFSRHPGSDGKDAALRPRLRQPRLPPTMEGLLPDGGLRAEGARVEGWRRAQAEISHARSRE